MDPMSSAEIASKILANATARDKINRFVQYYAKFLIWVGQKNDFSAETITKIQSVMNMFSTTRKVMRLGKQIEYFKNARQALSIKDEITSLLTASKFFGLGMWLMYDVLGLAHSYKLHLQEDIKLINKRGNQFWLSGLTSSFLLNFYNYRWNAIRLAQELKINKQIPALDKVDKLEKEKVKSLKAFVKINTGKA
jgi:peroxin-11B